MNEVMDIIGSISNAIAAIAAVVAIIVTIKHYKSEKTEQKQERITGKRGILFKESVIDSCLKNISEDISVINHELIQLSKEKSVTTKTLKKLYRSMRSTSQNWLYEMEIIKVFNEELYNEVKTDVENIVDAYSVVISEALAKGEVLEKPTAKIDSRLMLMRRRIYKTYFTLV